MLNQEKEKTISYKKQVWERTFWLELDLLRDLGQQLRNVPI